MLYKKVILWIIHFSAGAFQTEVNSVPRKEKVLGGNYYVACETESKD